MTIEENILWLLDEYQRLGIAQQLDYEKFYLYSIITHSTAIEGSTVTEIENQLLFDEGISAKGRTMHEQLMNIDLKKAYEQAAIWAKEHKAITTDMLKQLSALVMKNTGTVYNTMSGNFDSSKGDIRLVNVTAGAGGRSYMSFLKVPTKLQEFCTQINQRREQLTLHMDTLEAYRMSFDAHLQLVTIHPWADGNGRMSRLLMNYLQFECGLVPTKVSTEDKASYIQALIDSRENESPEPFRQFMFASFADSLTQEIAQYRHSMEEDIVTEVDKKTTSGGQENSLGGQENSSKAERKATTAGQETREQLLNLIASDDNITSTRMAEVIGINRSAVTRHLKILQEEGLLRREGPTKGGRWVTSHNK